MTHITIIGLDGRSLYPEAEGPRRDAALVAGGERHLEMLGVESGRVAVLKGNLSEVLVRIQETDGPVVVLASGDPGFFGIVRLLAERFGREHLRVMPGVPSAALGVAPGRSP